MQNLQSDQPYPKIPSGFFHKKIKGSYLIMHPHRPSWIIVNDVGWNILKLFNGNHPLSDIVQVIESKYNVKNDRVEKDVHEFMNSFAQSGLFDEDISKGEKLDPGFQSVYIHITNRCNWGCRHCYYPENREHYGEELAEVDILNFLDDFFSKGGRQVTLSGGEPLLRKDLLRKILQSNKKASFNLLTNGSLLDDEFAKTIADYNVSIQISIDGSKEKIHDSIRGKGAFQRTMEGIKVLQKNGLGERTNTCTTIMNQNSNDLKNILELAKQLGIAYVRYIPLLKEGRACRNWNNIQIKISEKENEGFYKYIFEKAKKEYPNIRISSGLCGLVLDSKAFDDRGHWCPIEKNLVIDTKGDVYPCPMFMNKSYMMGNINVNRIDDLKHSRIRKDLVVSLTERKNRIKECRRCFWKNLCQGGCMGLALHSRGNIWCRDEFCHHRKNIYKKAVEKLIDGKTPHLFKDEGWECL